MMNKGSFTSKQVGDDFCRTMHRNRGKYFMKIDGAYVHWGNKKHP